MDTPIDTLTRAFKFCTAVDKQLYSMTEAALDKLAAELSYVGYGTSSEIDAIFEELNDYMNDIEKLDDEDEDDDIDFDDEEELRDVDID